jgi:hypothetical protein
MKRVVLFTLIALALSSCALLVVHPPRRLIAPLIAYALYAFSGNPPAIAQGEMTDQDWTRAQGADRKFTAVLVRRFPDGTSETALKSVLLRQGFRFPPSPPANCIPPGQPPPAGVAFYRCITEEQEKIRQRTLEYRWGIIICTNHATVRWSADDHSGVTNVRGTFHQICL